MMALMYHDVVDSQAWDSSGFPGEWPALYKLSREDFTAHVAAIRESLGDTPTPRIDELRETDTEPFAITFDDGGASAHTVIAGILEQARLPGHFFVSTAYIGTPGFASAAEIRDLRRRGHVIGSHSHSHPTRMSACSRQELDREWRDSLRVLEDIVQEPVTVASVPGGFYSRAVGEAAAAAGVRWLFTSEPTQRVTTVDGCLVFGRYAIRRGVTARKAGEYARRDTWTLWRDSCVWGGKKLVKRVAGKAYVELGARLLRKR